MKNISDIQFEGTNNDIVWRSPITDFETGSKLTVYESQEALFYLNGACIGILGPGSHILETENIPFLKRLIQKFTGNSNIFHAQVYFVNKVELDLKWGIGDIVYQDPAGPVFSIGCHGQVNITADVSRKIVEKLVGTQPTLSRDNVLNYFRDLVSAEISDKLLNSMLDNNISIINLSSKLLNISQILTPIISDLFSDYGFTVEQFRIKGVNLPENDPEYIRLKRLRADQGMMLSEQELIKQRELIKQQTEAEKIKMEAEAMAFKRRTEGYDYATEKQFEFLNQIAQKEGSSAGISSDMMQMGVGLGMIGTVGSMMQKMTSPIINSMDNMVQRQPGEVPAPQQNPLPQQNPAPQQSSISEQVTQQPSPALETKSETSLEPSAPDTEPMTLQDTEPAAQPDSGTKDPLESLKMLKLLLNSGLIEQSEYDEKKKEILSRL